MCTVKNVEMDLSTFRDIGWTKRTNLFGRTYLLSRTCRPKKFSTRRGGIVMDLLVMNEKKKEVTNSFKVVQFSLSTPFTGSRDPIFIFSVGSIESNLIEI